MTTLMFKNQHLNPCHYVRIIRVSLCLQADQKSFIEHTSCSQISRSIYGLDIDCSILIIIMSKNITQFIRKVYEFITAGV